MPRWQWLVQGFVHLLFSYRPSFHFGPLTLMLSVSPYTFSSQSHTMTVPSPWFSQTLRDSPLSLFQIWFKNRRAKWRKTVRNVDPLKHGFCNPFSNFMTPFDNNFNKPLYSGYQQYNQWDTSISSIGSSAPGNFPWSIPSQSQIYFSEPSVTVPPPPSLPSLSSSLPSSSTASSLLPLQSFHSSYDYYSTNYSTTETTPVSSTTNSLDSVRNKTKEYISYDEYYSNFTPNSTEGSVAESANTTITTSTTTQGFSTNSIESLRAKAKQYTDTNPGSYVDPGAYGYDGSTRDASQGDAV